MLDRVEPLISPERLRDEARRQRRHLVVTWLVGVLIVAGLVVVAAVAGEPALGLLAALLVPALVIATIATRREASRWEAGAAAEFHERRGTITGFSTNTYGVRWGVVVALDQPAGSSIRLMFRRTRNPGYGKKRLRIGDIATVQLADAGVQMMGALCNERTSDVVLVTTRQPIT